MQTKLAQTILIDATSCYAISATDVFFRFINPLDVFLNPDKGLSTMIFYPSN